MDEQATIRSQAQRIALQRLESLRRAGVHQFRRISITRTGAAPSVATPAAKAPVKSVAAPARLDTPISPGSAASAEALAPVAPASSAAMAPAANSDNLRRPTPAATMTKPAPKSSSPPASPASSSRSLANEERQAALRVLNAEVVKCTKCYELACTRTQTVFGVGNCMARLCFIGEAPGADEDVQGEPFVGKAGQLLNKIIEACTLTREDVYIMNVLKCRPPNNRTPSEEEAANCRDFFNRQLDIIRPEFICCLGAVAAQNLLSTTVSIGRLRRTFHDYRGIKVVATYHPAYLLRNPNAKRDVWEDMQMLMAAMGIKLPERGSQ